VNSAFSSGTKSGYSFTWSPGATGAFGNYLNYAITAQPVNPGTTGRRCFYTDQSRRNPLQAERRGFCHRPTDSIAAVDDFVTAKAPNFNKIQHRVQFVAEIARNGTRIKVL
jgi:hypothetical protein